MSVGPFWHPKPPYDDAWERSLGGALIPVITDAMKAARRGEVDHRYLPDAEPFAKTIVAHLRRDYLCEIAEQPREDSRGDERERLVREIAEKLFTNGAGEKAVRLVLELKDGRDGGGWGLLPVEDVIRAALRAHPDERRIEGER